MSNGSNVIVQEKNDTITIKHHSPKVEPNSRQEKELARGREVGSSGVFRGCNYVLCYAHPMCSASGNGSSREPSRRKNIDREG